MRICPTLEQVILWRDLHAEEPPYTLWGLSMEAMQRYSGGTNYWGLEDEYWREHEQA